MINRVFQQELVQALRFAPELLLRGVLPPAEALRVRDLPEKKFGVQVLSGLDAVLSRDPKTFKIVPVFKSTFAKTRDGTWSWPRCRGSAAARSWRAPGRGLRA